MKTVIFARKLQTWTGLLLIAYLGFKFITAFWFIKAHPNDVIDAAGIFLVITHGTLGVRAILTRAHVPGMDLLAHASWIIGLIVAGIVVVSNIVGEGEGKPAQPTAVAPGPNPGGAGLSGAEVTPGPNPGGVGLSAAAVAGNAVFVSHCTKCHTFTEPHRHAPNLFDAKWDQIKSQADFRDMVLEGEPKRMPSFKGALTATELDELVAFLDPPKGAGE